ncbi:glucosaminidase domain-containing protein [Peptostreptococcaceae bacterium OttesenSCG-928-C18]|nr:glucosaminidase domain-containing protein [Peptostreptococcaceae bacterium OttesenSCG-928-C18]
MAISKEQQDFIAKVGAVAAEDMEKSGILASLIIAQAILESGWGMSELAANANALFGIKAGSRWNGRVFSIATKECYDGVNFTDEVALFRAYDSWEDSIADHSAFLVGSSRYAAVIGEKDYKIACTAIHAAGYATDPTYAEKLITIIESYDLDVYDTAYGKDDCKMNLKTLLLTKNACYIAGKTIVPQGIMVHSTGANNPNLKRYVGPNDGLLGDNQYNNHWNQANPGGRQVCVHAFIGKLADGSIATYQTLPWNHRGWHAGGTANNTHISFEICEDSLTDADYFNKVYQEAVELCAYLCKMYGLSESNIIGHYEGYKKGIASNHADPGHWFAKHGKSMDTFRAAVKNALVGGASAPSEPTADNEKATLYRVRKSWSDSKSQKGAYKILANAKKCADENSGYSVFDENGKAIYPNVDTLKSFMVRVKITDLNIRKGPGTNHAKTGKCTGIGTFTIVEEQSGQGSTAGWGKLKSGAGWISLDYCTKV